MLILYLVLFLILILFVFCYYVFKLGMCRNASKDKVLRNKFNSASTEGRIEIVNDIQWFNKNHQEVEIKSSDGLLLKGYIINNKKNNNWVLIAHGFTSDHTYMVNRAQKFNDLGYNVLLIDMRSHGKSEGKYISMGIKDSDDIKLWSEYLVKKNKAKKIVLFGISMGAGAVMMSLDNGLPKEVKCAIEDCGYTSVYEEYKYQLKNIFHLPAFPFLHICNMYARIFAKFDFMTDSAIDSVANSNIPLMLIHGTKDTFVPYYMLDELVNACKSEKEVLIVEGANHTEAQYLEYDKYWKTVEKFMNKY